MSIEKGNKLLQELHDRLTGHWYKQGKYRKTKINVAEVKDYIDKIKHEYDTEEKEQ